MDERRSPTPAEVTEPAVFRDLVDRHAIERPDKVFAKFAGDEPDWTYSDLRRKVLQTAEALFDAGVGQRDHVISWLENGPMALRVWIAVNYMGAVVVPLNIAYKGGLLEHALELSDAKVAVTHSSLVARFSDIKTGPVETVFAVGADIPAAPAGIQVLPGTALTTGPETVSPRPLQQQIEVWDTQAILFTSGTTGPSKAVVTSNLHLWTTTQVCGPSTTEDDRALVFSPLFHVTGMSNVCWALNNGGSIGVLERFDTSTFWKDALNVGGTFFVLMGSVATFLANLPVTDEEKNTTLRLALLAPMTPEGMSLCRRTGIEFYSVFNQTEISVPLITSLNPTVPYTCGRPRQGAEVRIVDEHDIEVPEGTVGELIVRTDSPWAMNSGYYKNPEATAKAWRNGWFHTGDALRRDANGNYFYVDRVKDSIRRRGENISSYEVEVEVQAHPDVAEAAAVAVPSDLGEDDVLIVVVLREDARLDPAEMIAFLVNRMPHYMVPRYIRTLDEFPKTPTLRVQKAVLRDEGITDDTWDREEAGISIKRERVTDRSPGH